MIKGYDQSVTCLADDLRNIGTRSSTLRTPGVLSQATIAYISNKQRCTSKTQIKEVDQKVQIKNSGSQKESNQMEQRNSNYERNKIQILMWTKVKFYSTKILFKLVKRKEGFETKM